jgi:hypothetical protein
MAVAQDSVLQSAEALLRVAAFEVGIMMGPEFTIRCWLFGHNPVERLRHGFCNDSDTEFTFCERCSALYKDIDGEWIRQ